MLAGGDDPTPHGLVASSTPDEVKGRISPVAPCRRRRRAVGSYVCSSQGMSARSWMKHRAVRSERWGSSCPMDFRWIVFATS